MTKPAHPPEEAALYRRIRAGDPVERNRMAERHFGLVSSVATYYAKRNPHLDMDDLLQEGRIGVVVALEKYNVDKGWRFSTYATYWIRHHIQRFVVANHSGGLSAKRKDTEAYIGLRMSKDDKELYQQRCLDVLTTAWDNGQGGVFENVLEGDADVEGEVFDEFEQQAALAALVSPKLNDIERAVIAMRYGVLGQRPQTAPQVARRMSMTVYAVTLVEERAIAILHELLEVA